MGLFDLFKSPDSETQVQQAASAQRQADILQSLRSGSVPASTRTRLEAARSGSSPWIATLTPAELFITRSHGIRPIASISATCWLHYGWSWTLGHSQGWETALRRLREEAKAAGANAVLDVKMRTIPLGIESSMDFTLVGTAVKIDSLPPSSDPIVATVPALEFVKLLEADVVPIGIAIGAHYEWMNDWRGSARQTWMGNVESPQLSSLWEEVRQRAHAELRQSAESQGNGVLAHINFSQIFEREGANDSKRYLARHIVLGTTVDAQRGVPIPHDIQMVVDMHAGKTPLTGSTRHHQSYASNDSEGAI
jgi:Putative heavy-metal-binding